MPSVECHDSGEQFVLDTVEILINKTQSESEKQNSLRLVYEQLCLNMSARQDKERSSGKMSVNFSDILQKLVSSGKIPKTSTPSDMVAWESQSLDTDGALKNNVSDSFPSNSDSPLSYELSDNANVSDSLTSEITLPVNASDRLTRGGEIQNNESEGLIRDFLVHDSFSCDS